MLGTSTATVTKPAASRRRCSSHSKPEFSNFSWFANAFAGYQLKGDFQLGLSYRVLSVDYETGSGEDFFGWDGLFSSS